MIMEDLNPIALVTPRDPNELRVVIRQLSGAVVKMGSIVAAAAALLG
jgi:hypothetical protein